MRAPELFCLAHGIGPVSGPHPCFWCGSACPAVYTRSANVSNTFTGWGEVAAPHSGYVCYGCVLATHERDKAMRPRQASWIVTREGVIRCKTSETEPLRDACLNPPAPPYVIVLAISGKKHLIYRAPVNQSTDWVSVQLELERVTYRPDELAQRLALVQRLASVVGPAVLRSAPDPGIAAVIAGRDEEWEAMMETWQAVWSEPLTRLALFLCPPRKELEQPAKRAGEPARKSKDDADIKRRRQRMRRRAQRKGHE